jgi:hypothetical protein
MNETHTNLIGEIAPGWKLIQPLPVLIQQDEDGEYLVTDEVFHVYGEGATSDAAQQDYIQSLVEYHALISSYDDDLVFG